jgi:hypothetical protein
MLKPRFLSLVLLAALGGCQTAPALPGDWSTLSGAGWAHPHEDARRLHQTLVETADGDTTAVYRVVSYVGGEERPLAGVDVFTTRERGPLVPVDEDSTPESVASDEAAAGSPPERLTAAVTDADGIARLRDPLLANPAEPVFLVFSKPGFFSETLERRPAD